METRSKSRKTFEKAKSQSFVSFNLFNQMLKKLSIPQPNFLYNLEY